MSYADLVAADMRLAVLQVLEQDPDYAHNEHVLSSVLAQLGHAVSRDKLRTEAHWMAEQGLVTVTDVAGVAVIKLTARGEDVALGRARVPGVARPRPGV